MIGRPVAVQGIGAISTFGIGWRGLGTAVAGGGLREREITALPIPADNQEARARVMMSRGALLASIATGEALLDADWVGPRENMGFYFGVGASGGAADQLTSMLAATIEDGTFSIGKFGTSGLRACNPLYAFQLMNNFTMCHAAILHGIAGPNAVFFSRGAGTVTALVEAVHAVADRECARVLTGGSDSALHPVTRAELSREGFIPEGFDPTEGAAVLALGVDFERAVAVVEDCMVTSIDQAAECVRALDPATFDLVMIAPWGASRRDTLTQIAKRELPEARIVDLTATFGDSLAATPALACAGAIDLLGQTRRTHAVHRAVVLTAGVDGDVGIVSLSSGRQP